MKTRINFGIKIISVLIIIMMTAWQTSFAQDAKTKDMKLKETKLSRQKQMQKNKQQILELVNSRKFVLENNFIQNDEGRRVFINPMFNFIKIEGDTAIVQLSFKGLLSWNGLGGITVQGHVDKFEVDPGKSNKPIFVQLHIQGAGVASYQFLSIDSDGNSTLTVNSDHGGTVSFIGNIVPIDKSVVMQGHITNF